MPEIAQSSATEVLAPEAFAPKLQRLWSEGLHWLDIHSFEILVGCIFAAVIVFGLIFMRGLGVRLCRKGAPGSLTVIVGRTIAKTNIFFIGTLALRLIAAYARAPHGISRIVDILFVIALVIQTAIWARELILGFIEHRAGLQEESSLGSATGIIRLLVNAALFAIALVFILDNVGVNVTGLVAGLGIGGIAIGLAAQGIFSDLFAALSILFDKPFRKGEVISWADVTGTVEAIGLKTTRLRSLNGEQIVVSNANLLNKELHNFTHLSQRRVHTLFGLIYQTPVDVLEQVEPLLKEIVERHDKTAVLRAGMTGFGASSLDFELLYDVQGSDYQTMFETRQSINLAILREFADRGIGFAYPTQTTFTAAPDGRMVMPYPEVKMVTTDALAPGKG